MAEPKDERELVDVNHPYMTEHDEKDFVWAFDSDKAIMWAGAVIGSIIEHTMHGGPEHATEQVALQAGMLVSDAREGTQFPVLMLHNKDENGSEGYVPVAILLVGNDKVLDIAHTLGSLVDDEGVHPALPSRNQQAFYSPPEPEKPPTVVTVFDLLRKQQEDDA